MIRRYATPDEYFILPFAANAITKISATYLQNEDKKIEKNKSEIQIYDMDHVDDIPLSKKSRDKLDHIITGRAQFSIAAIHLSQEETAEFTFHKAEEKNIALIQLHIVDLKERSFVSRPIRVRVRGSINDEVL